MAKTKKGDFIEIEYIGYANGEIFDTNIKEKAKEINLEIEVKPLVLCIGQEMVVKGFDKQLEDKETGKKYKIEISSEEGFGKRNPSLIKTIPMSAFRQQNMNPMPGMMLNLDGMIAKILSVSGGRVITDFNNPLSGKDIEYEFTIKKITTDDNEKINSLQDFFFKKRFKFKIQEKKILFESQAQPFVKIMGKKLGEMLDKEIDFEKPEKKQGKENKEPADAKKPSKKS
jgi:FKBP-type peptidyl-prolyl cis-trans isomerase 2